MNIDVPQQVVNALWLGSLYSLFALGYALIFSVLGLLNLSHSAVFVWGAFIGLYAACGDQVYASTCSELARPIWIAVPMAMIGAGLISVVVDRIAFWPLRERNAPRMNQLISSIGAAALLVNLAQLRFGAAQKRFPPGSIPTKRINDLPIVGHLPFVVTPIQISVLIIALLLMIALHMLVMRTRLGRGMRTVAFSGRIAGLFGVNVDRTYMIAFFISGALAGAAGMLYGLAFNSMTPFMGESVSLKGLTVIVLGGLGSIEGAVVGGFLVAGIEVFSVALGRSDFRDAFVFLLLFLILLVRPQGLLGQPVEDRA
jgi:branched-chain amino acid transport system permease protein